MGGRSKGLIVDRKLARKAEAMSRNATDAGQAASAEAPSQGTRVALPQQKKESARNETGVTGKKRKKAG
jgi:anti-sigma factor ChrR (cupin superfamily)